jgi:8-oxo-dGTP pyrophosphatase MutT (NUDIX family)
MARKIRQAAALAIRDGKVCMVSSRNRRRWVIPKGLIEKGQSASDAALAEAWEEAGLIGHIENQSLGTFIYTKNNLEHHVTVYAMTVAAERDEWPEGELRKREWVSVDEALVRIEEAGLRQLLQLHVGLVEASV